jgi:hypothetical protein
MIKFLDGPAKGTELNLRRAPVLLRVVIDRDGKVDALDQLDDLPTPTEKMYVYIIIPHTLTTGIACSRRRGEGCVPLLNADYKLYGTQPTDEQMRDGHQWRAWTEKQKSAEEVAAAMRKFFGEASGEGN